MLWELAERVDDRKVRDGVSVMSPMSIFAKPSFSG